ncbi:MAG: glycosyl transferase [Halieaceae bacterium MED-G27]|nr:MAG: glycosyl transferase [Halieaceae bacterium MED-G27]
MNAKAYTSATQRSRSQAHDDEQPLRIALLGYRSAPHSGGQGIYVKYLSRSLAKLGHQVTVISGPPYPELDDSVSLVQLPSLDLYEHGLRSVTPCQLLNRLNLIEWFSKLTGGFAEPWLFGERFSRWYVDREGSFDVIHDNQTLAYGILKVEEGRTPLVTTIHHPITRDYAVALAAEPKWYLRLLIHRWHGFLRMQKRVAKRLSAVVTVSQASAIDIAADFAVKPEAISVMPLGVDIDVFRPLSGVQREPFRLMTTASADAPLKGLPVLLKAMARLRPQFPGLMLTLIGKPKTDGETRRLINSLGLDEAIDYRHGISTEEMVACYAKATVAVVPSLYEGFGLPAIEAMACGVPLVSTNGGALPEVVGEAGQVVAAGDEQALASAIAGLLSSSEERERLAAAGRDRAINEYCWDRCAERMVAYYREVIALC